MSLKFDGDYYAKATDAGPRVPPSFPSDSFIQNYDNIIWDKENVNESTQRKSEEDSDADCKR